MLDYLETLTILAQLLWIFQRITKPCFAHHYFFPSNHLMSSNSRQLLNNMHRTSWPNDWGSLMTYNELKYNMNVIRKNKYFKNVHDYLPAVYISTLMANPFFDKASYIYSFESWMQKNRLVLFLVLLYFIIHLQVHWTWKIWDNITVQSVSEERWRPSCLLLSSVINFEPVLIAQLMAHKTCWNIEMCSFSE